MATKKTLNIGLIGGGFMGRTHSNGYRRVPNFFPDLEYTPVLKAVCFRNETRNLFWMVFDSPEKRKDRHRVIRVLGLHHAEVDGAAVDAWRRTGFQAADP